MKAMNQLADRVLVETFLLMRDETVFRILYRRHKASLWHLALKLTGGNAIAAEDIVQDAWLRAVEKLPQFRWESSLRTWLSGFVVYRTREFWRTELAENLQFMPLENALFETVAPNFSFDSLDIEQAFKVLPPGFRAVLTLYDVEGFKHEEIATMLGISVGTSKSQLSRAREAFRKLLI